LAKHFKAKITTPWKELPKDLRNAILHGTKDPIKFVYDDGVRRYETTKNFEGVLPNLERRWKETDSAWVREDLEKYQSEAPCPTCRASA
jgi:excinuclease ABC subunit A